MTFKLALTVQSEPPVDTGAWLSVTYLAAALDSTEVPARDRELALPSLTRLGAQLAERAASAGHFGLAELARVLLARIDRVSPSKVDSAESKMYAEAMADVMRVALDNPKDPRNEYMAIKIAGPLARVAPLSPNSVSEVIAQMIAPPVMAEWGGSVIYYLLENLAELCTANPDMARRVILSVWEYEEDRNDTTLMGRSQILPLRSTRRQDLEMARYRTGESFQSLLKCAPDVAFDVFLTLVATHSVSHESIRARAGGVQVYASELLEGSSGYGALDALANGVVKFLVDASASPDQNFVHDSLERLADQLTHDQVWRAIIQASVSHPQTLGRFLMPLLNGGDLLGHPCTHAACVRLVRVLSPVLADAEHRDLEEAILHSHDPIGGGATDSQDMTDSLVEQLDAHRIQTEEIRKRYNSIQTAPPSRPADPGTPIPSDGTPIPELSGHADESSFDSIKTTLMDDIRRCTAGGPANHQSVESLAMSLTVLDRLTGPGAKTQDGNEPTDARSLLLRGAQILAHNPSVLPVSEIGDLILRILVTAVEDVAQEPSTTGWTAVEGLATLQLRSEWRSHPGSTRIPELLRPLLDSPDEAVRAAASSALPYIIGPQELPSALLGRLAHETADIVVAALTRGLANLTKATPEQADSCLSNLSVLPQWQGLNGVAEDVSVPLRQRAGVLGDNLLRILLYLHLEHHSQFASTLIKSWQSIPTRYPATIARMVIWTRDYLQSVQPDTQARAFELFTNIANSIVPIIEANGEAAGTDSLDETTENELEAALWIAYHIAQTTYHASGAFRHPNDRTEPDTRSVSPGFCSLALPLAQVLARAHDPAVAHPLVETLVFLSRLEPKSAFVIIGTIVSASPGYEHESLGQNLVMDLVDVWLAEHRNLILNDQECMASLRQILEAFIRSGSDRALRRVQDLADLFR